jgi:hypothetical protein
MALYWDASTERVNHGSDASLEDLGVGEGAAFSVWAWVYRDADGTNQYIITKDGSYPSGWGFLLDDFSGGTDGQIRFIVFRTTDSAAWTEYISNSSNVAALNTWTFVAATFDADATPETLLYIGDLSTTVAEVSGYSKTQDGTEAASTDATYECWTGNLPRTTAHPFSGRIARLGVVGATMSLGDLQRIQYASVGQCNIANTLLLTDYHGTGTQADFSGNGNNGTVTGATATSHVPLGPAFGFDVGVPYVAAAAPATAIQDVIMAGVLPVAR